MSSTAPEPLSQPTVATTPPAPVASAHTAPVQPDDVIDLRVYFNVLLRWWKEIILIGILCGVVAGAGWYILNATRTTTYTAAAEVAITRTISEVTLDERFVTSTDAPNTSASVARRNALIGLAGNPALAQAVIDDLGAALPQDLRQPAELASIISASMASVPGRTGDIDLIRIVATTDDPMLSSLIATTWAQAYVRNVNQTYGQVPDELFASMSREQENGRVAYEAAQAALEDFLTRSRVDELSRLVSDRETVITTLRRSRNDLLNGLAANAVDARTQVAEAIGDAQAQNLAAPIVAEQEGKRDLVEAWVDTIYQGQSAIVTQQGARDRALLNGHYTRWLQASLAIAEAQALRSQTQALIDAGADDAGGSGSNALVLALLKLQAFTTALDSTSTQDLSLDSPSDVNINAAASDATAAAAPGLLSSSQPVQVQVGATPLQIQLSDTTEMSNAQILAELNALIISLEEKRDAAQNAIDTHGAAILDGSSIQITDPEQIATNAVAMALPGMVDTILGRSIITGTTSALDAVASWEVGNFASLYNTAELQALALTGTDDTDLARVLANAESDVRAIKAELEAERTTQNELTTARDLAQDAYRAANSKMTELALQRAAGGSEVRFAAPAIEPNKPNGSLSPIVVAMGATFAGLVLGMIMAFVADAMGKQPFLSRRRQPATLAPAH